MAEAARNGGLAMFMVTGATGTVGRPLVESLVGEGVKVRAVTRDPASAGCPPRWRSSAVTAALSMQADAVGHPATVTTDPANLLGRRAHTFPEWVAAHIDAFTA